MVEAKLQEMRATSYDERKLAEIDRLAVSILANHQMLMWLQAVLESYRDDPTADNDNGYRAEIGCLSKCYRQLTVGSNAVITDAGVLKMFRAIWHDVVINAKRCSVGSLVDQLTDKIRQVDKYQSRDEAQLMLMADDEQFESFVTLREQEAERVSDQIRQIRCGGRPSWDGLLPSRLTLACAGDKVTAVA